MILYTLVCEAGHRFESWFRDSAAYDGQVAEGLVSCTRCQSTQVAKTIMAPAVVNGRSSVLEPGPSNPQPAKPESTPPDAALPASGGEAALVDDDTSLKLRALLRAVRDKVVAEGHDVGAEFAMEARRMHEGETPVRQIYGQATPAEARELLEDGIAVLPMPVAPDELN